MLRSSLHMSFDGVDEMRRWLIGNHFDFNVIAHPQFHLFVCSFVQFGPIVTSRLGNCVLIDEIVANLYIYILSKYYLLKHFTMLCCAVLCVITPKYVSANM